MSDFFLVRGFLPFPSADKFPHCQDTTGGSCIISSPLFCHSSPTDRTWICVAASFFCVSKILKEFMGEKHTCAIYLKKTGKQLLGFLYPLGFTLMPLRNDHFFTTFDDGLALPARFQSNSMSGKKIQRFQPAISFSAQKRPRKSWFSGPLAPSQMREWLWQMIPSPTRSTVHQVWLWPCRQRFRAWSFQTSI